MNVMYIGKIDFICDGHHHKNGMKADISAKVIERYPDRFKVLDCGDDCEGCIHCMSHEELAKVADLKKLEELAEIAKVADLKKLEELAEIAKIEADKIAKVAELKKLEAIKIKAGKAKK